jgi:serine/threonine protein kinase
MECTACPSEAELTAFHLGDLPAGAVDAVAAHLETCPRCEQIARRLDRLSDAVIASLRHLSADPGEPAAPAHAVEVPRQVGDYEILGELGRGGMGVVFKARDRQLGRTVALKMLLAGEFAQEHVRARFRAEAATVARFQHPTIVQVLDVGEWQGSAGGPPVPYFTLEYVDGGSLSTRLGEKPQPPRQAATWLLTLAQAVHYAHGRGIAHRDLKPSNVLVTADGRLKLCDFGVAKQLTGSDLQTGSGLLVGTPEYMAPEQARGQPAGPAADVYALGALLYTMLTGRPPLQGASVLDTLNQVRAREPVPPSRLQPQVPRDLETICLKCLHKEPRQRYATALDLAEDVGRFLEGRPIRARPVGVWERGRKWARRRPAVAGLLLTLAAVVLSSLAGLAGLWRRADEQRRQAVDNLGKAQAAEASARSAHRFLREALLEVARPEGKGYAVTIREALDQAAPRVGAAFAGQPEAEESVRATLGETYYKLGRYAEAEPQWRRVLQWRRDRYGEDHPETLTAVNNLALVLKDRGQRGEAEPLLRQNLGACRRVWGPDHPTRWTR